MRSKFLYVALMALALSATSCNDTNEVEKTIPEGTANVQIDAEDTEVTAENVANWTAYATRVAALLEQDAATLYADWNESYKGGEAFALQFKSHKAPYTSAESCVEQIIDGCIDIAGEVGTAKIGEPRNLWENGRYTEAVYAVESWYSFHSIDDYANNIRSIQNAFNGSRDGVEAERSIASYLKTRDAELYRATKAAIATAIDAIESMAAPFRSHIGNNSVLAAQDACADLDNLLTVRLKSFIANHDDEEAYSAIVDRYVDAVVLPTYKELADNNKALHEAVLALRAQPSSANFRAAAQAWMKARAPWETSEAFLFGPVDEEGLDPNMDSWPLDQAAITNILRTGKLGDLDIEDGASDSRIEAAQNVRGFHTLEYLLFKDGQPRAY